MRTKNTNPAFLLAGKSLQPIIVLYFQINHLKQLYRQGWLREGRDVPEIYCESDADHCFAMAVLGIFICDLYFPDANVLTVIMMCLLHELGEIIHGDPPSTDDPDLKAEKHRNERHAIVELLKDIPNAEKYIDLWEEFEEGKTLEARLVKQLDRLEMALQSKIYTLQHRNDLQEFIDGVYPHLESPELIAILVEVDSI